MLKQKLGLKGAFCGIAAQIDGRGGDFLDRDETAHRLMIGFLLLEIRLKHTSVIHMLGALLGGAVVGPMEQLAAKGGLWLPDALKLE